MKNIFSGSFWGCTGLTSIVIPNSVERIGEGAFRSCRNLASIVIGSKVSSFGNYAFDYCDNLREVTVLNPTPVSISKWVFPDRAKQILFIPKDSKDAYKAADVWKEFNVVAEIGSLPKVVEGDMNGDGVLTIMDALIIIEKVLGNQ